MIDSMGGFGQNGKGRTLDFALASAHAEFIERLQNNLLFGVNSILLPTLNKIREEEGFLFFPDEKQINETEFLSLPQSYLKDIFGDISTNEMKNLISKYYIRIKENGFDGVTAVPFYDFTDNKIVYLPYNITLMITGSNGMAAGNSAPEGVFQGLCEILERIAASTIYYERLTPPTIPISFIKQYAELYQIINIINKKGYDVIVKDFSLGKKLPVIGTIIINKKKNKYKLNVGADTCFEVALSRTLTEIYQGIENEQEFESLLLDIPQKEHSYFKKNSESFICKRRAQIEQFFINGGGVFPKSLFNKKESYLFNSKTFSEKETYVHEVKYLLGLISSLGIHIFLRNTSFLGFPSFYIYITQMSALRNNGLNRPLTDAIDLCSNIENNDIEKLIYNFSSTIKNKNAMRKFIEYYPIENVKKYDIKMADLFKIEVAPIHYWSKLPISYYLVIFAFLLEEYSIASDYLKIYLSTMKIKDSQYYKEVFRYFSYLKNRKSISFINHHINKEIINNFTKESLINEIDIPLCPDCDKCNIGKYCYTKSKIEISKRIMREMRQNSVSQNIFSSFLQY